jgi:hypothetical protein
MEKTEKKAEKPIEKSSLFIQGELYEMIYDKSNGVTNFVILNKSGQIETLDHIKLGAKTYKPLSPDNVLIDRGVILFPSSAVDYVSEEALLIEIQGFIHKYLDVTEVFEQIATYYVLFTWLYDKFNEVPYLRAIGDFGSGKSRLLQTVGSLCYKPIFTGGATTTSPIFRIVNEIKGTLVLDEADYRFSDMTSDIIKILNTGYQKGMPVLRSEGKGTFEVKAYDVFGPKIIATRETYQDKALESRFLVEEMGSSKLRKDIPRTLNQSFYDDAEAIRNKLLMWRLKGFNLPINTDQELIEGIHPRLNQIIIPLLSVIKNRSVKNRLKTFITDYNSELIADRGLSWESEIILAILRIKDETRPLEIRVKEIADKVNSEIEIGDEVITPRKVGWYLRQKLQLKSHRTRNGYVLDLKRNNKRLEMWQERYGFTEEDFKQLETINKPSEPFTPLTAKDIGF